MGDVEFNADGQWSYLLPRGVEEENALVGHVDVWSIAFQWHGAELHMDRGEVRLVSRTISARTLPFKRLDSASALEFRALCESLQLALARQDMAAALRAQGVLQQLIALYIDLPEEGLSTPGHRAVLRFERQLRAHAEQDVRITSFAREAGITPEHLRLLFRRRFGIRPVEYRQRLRLAKARELFANTNMSVKEVARTVGYPDALYFSRIFTRQLGLSPREMIRQYRLPR
ncbi:MAG TPA: helix-turn-helix transcriptional regulator [Planctomycetota bacterium]|nr:helix-turn-helix transcriptional regulator [Planctomycetota bacterium]